LPPPDLLEVGRIGRAHGVRGALSVTLITDRHERLAAGARLQANGIWLVVQSAKPAGDRWLVQFEGLTDRTAAEGLSGATLLAEPLADLDDEGWYVHDLIGARVVSADGTEHGRCVAVVANPAHDLLELESGALVPVVFVTAVEDGLVTIEPPEGLFDLA
jgi:16S rRNA processing protein RimM